MDAAPLVDTHDDDVQMVLVEPSDLNIHEEEPTQPGPEGDLTVDTIRTVSSLPDPTHETETKQFENRFLQLSHELSQAKAEFQVLEIELQSMGFTDVNATPDEVLTSMRAAFQQVRSQLDELLVEEDPNAHANGALLELMVNTIGRLLEQVKDMPAQIREHEQVEKTVWSQNSGLLDKLAASGERNEQLQSQWNKVDAESDAKSKAITELEESLDRFEEAVADRDEIIAEQNDTIESQDQEIKDQSKSLDRLKEAVQKYRDEMAGLESLIATMEEQHSSRIEQMEVDHAGELEQKKEEIESEQANVAAAEAEIQEKSRLLAELESRLDATKASLESSQTEFAKLQEKHSEELSRRQGAEDDLDDCRAQLDELESKMDEAEKTLEYLRSEVDSLGKLATAEKTSRENAELEIEERDDTIAQLEDNLATANQAAQDLRADIEKLQTLHQTQVTQLEQQSQERQDELQGQIDSESTDRREAEELAAERLQRIEQLEEEIQGLEQNLSDRGNELEELRNDFKAAEQEFETTLGGKEAELSTAGDDIDKKIEEIQALEKDRDQLEYQLHSLRTDFEYEQQATTSLSQELDEERARADGAEEAVADKEAHIANLEEDLAGSRTQVGELTATLSSRDMEINDLHGYVADLKRRVQVEVERGQKAVSEVVNSMREGILKAEEVEKHFVHEGEEGLRQARSVGHMALMHGNATASQAVRASDSPSVGRWFMDKVVGKRGRRKFDSGIGVDDGDSEVDLDSPLESPIPAM
jgi:chromosome segregation ATPase